MEAEDKLIQLRQEKSLQQEQLSLQRNLLAQYQEQMAL